MSERYYKREDFIEGYQVEAHQFALYKDDNYPVLALGEETGEVLALFAKAARGDKELDHRALVKELGDVMWNVAEICTLYGIDLGAVCEFNLDKLYDRQARGKIQGNGDER